MTKAERARFIDQYLEEKFPEVAIPLHHTDAYTLLIATLLSAQCTDERVNKVTPDLFKLAPTPEKMVRLDVKEIENIVRPCGLGPQKAKAIWNLSQLLLEKHGGKVPQTFEELEALPGVGHKTSSVVRTQAFGLPAFPVDTHIHRLGQMWQLTSGKSVAQTERDLKKSFPEERWNKIHLQIIYYGRTICPARGCNGLRCDLCQRLFPDRKRPRSYHRA